MAAEKTFHELMLARPKTTPKSDTVVAILDPFLAWNDANRKPRTQEIYLRFLQPFAESSGTIRTDELRTHYVQQFIDTLMDSHFVAVLSGHRDSRMIDHVYGHAKDDWQLMRDKLRGSGTGAAPSSSAGS